MSASMHKGRLFLSWLCLICMGMGPLCPVALSAETLRLTCRPSKSHFLSCVGEQAGLWGNAITGVEAWIYPFKLGSSLTFEYAGLDEKPVGGRDEWVTRQVTMPHLSQVNLKSRALEVVEHYFVPRRTPAVVFLLDIKTRKACTVHCHVKPSLAPMLLDAETRPAISFDRANRQLVAVEKGRNVMMRIWSPALTGHKRGKGGLETLTLTISADRAARGKVPIIMAAGWPEGPDAQATIKSLAGRVQAEVDAAEAHYASLLARAPRVTSPDSMVNKAMAWSTVSLHQLRVKNPFLGHGLVSGYSPSGDTSRPCYAWFFDEPTLTSWAFLRAGLAGHVRNAFDMLLRFQREDGKMVHEITQSLPLHKDYFKTYQWAYIHSSSGTYLLAAFGHYYRATGDLAYVKKHWPALCRMLEWCFKAADPDDGILQVAPRDWGSSESSFAVGKDTQMAGMWIVALREMAFLADALKDQSLAGRCRRAAKQASESLEAAFWNEPESNYLWGLDRAGRPMTASIPHHAVCAWLGALRGDRVALMLRRMAASDFRTDWGVRSLAAGAERYNPEGYQTGTVWPVWNAGVLICDYRHGRAVEGFRNFRAMCRLRFLQASGPMPEVLRGDRFERLKTGVPHQMFSEIAVQNGFYDGLLGLALTGGGITLRPQLPASWGKLQVDRIPVPGGLLDLQIQKTRAQYELQWKLKSDRRLSFTLAAGKAPALLPDGRGTHTLVWRPQDGPAFMVEDGSLIPGEPSRALRLIQADWRNDSWHMTVEGLPGRVYALAFFTGDKPDRIEGGDLHLALKHRCWIHLKSPPDTVPLKTGYVRWNVKIQWDIQKSKGKEE